VSHPKITATCPSCGARLVLRTNHQSGSQFMGCERWPECHYTRPLPESVRMRLAGEPTLPGFE